MSRRREGCHFVLTPAGAGVASLFFPGLVVAVVVRQPLLLSVAVGSGCALLANAVVARRMLSGVTFSAHGPATSTVGERYSVQLGIQRASPMACALAVEGGVSGWSPAVAPSRVETLIQADRRAVVDRLAVRLRTAAPLGLVGCVRTSMASLQRPIHVGPRLVEVAMDDDVGGRAPTASWASIDEYVGLRPYSVGDSPRDVHWASVARTGSLLVRDRRAGFDKGNVSVIVDTSDAGADLDDLLGRARSVLERLVAAGWQVELTTSETANETRARDSLPTTGRVASVDGVIRRLSSVEQGPIGSDGWKHDAGPALTIDAAGQRWHDST